MDIYKRLTSYSHTQYMLISCPYYSGRAFLAQFGIMVDGTFASSRTIGAISLQFLEAGLVTATVGGTSQTYASLLVDLTGVTYYSYTKLLQVHISGSIAVDLLADFTTLLVTELQTQYAGIHL